MNQTRYPVVEIEFGGKTRHLCFDFNAKAELESLAASLDGGTARLKVLRATTWAMLLGETLDKRGRDTKETLSLLEVGEILAAMSTAELDVLSDKLLEAANLSAIKADADRPTTADSPKAA